MRQSMSANEGFSVSDTQAQPAAAPPVRGTGMLKFGAFLLVVGLIALGFGLLSSRRVANYDPNVVYCGDDVMTRDHVCLDFSGDGGGSYREVFLYQKANNETNKTIARVGMLAGPALLGLALLLFVVGGIRFYRGLPDPDPEVAERLLRQ